MLAFFLGILLAVKRAGKVGFSLRHLDLSLWILFSSLIGSRGLYVLTHISEFQGAGWTSSILPERRRIGIAGMVLLGGVSQRLSFDLFCPPTQAAILENRRYYAPSLALGIALGRIGCFATCCYGTDAILAGSRLPPGSPGLRIPKCRPPHSTFRDDLVAAAVRILALRRTPEEIRRLHLFALSDRLRRFPHLGGHGAHLWTGEILFHIGSAGDDQSGISVLMIIFGLSLFVNQRKKQNAVDLNALLTCPACGHAERMVMPPDY